MLLKEALGREMGLRGKGVSGVDLKPERKIAPRNAGDRPRREISQRYSFIASLALRFTLPRFHSAAFSSGSYTVRDEEGHLRRIHPSRVDGIPKKSLTSTD